MTVSDTVFDLLAPVVASLGVELIDVEWIGSSLRVVVDEADRSQGSDTGAVTTRITTDRLVEVNRIISPILDQHDPIPGRYTLEVSSPGVERKLTRPDHFRRAVGEDVIVKRYPGEGPRRLKGRLSGVTDDAITLDVVEIDGIDQAEVASWQVDVADIAQAKTVFEWGPSPKPGSAGTKQRQTQKLKNMQSEDLRHEQ